MIPKLAHWSALVALLSLLLGIILTLGRADTPQEQLLFLSNEARLFRMTDDGSHVVPLTPPRLTVQYPVWSPDGQFIAFIGSSPKDRIANIYRVSITGQGLEALTHTTTPYKFYGLAWSPNGKFLVTFSLGSSGVFSVEKIAVDGSGQITLVDRRELLKSVSRYSLDWSPDGRQLVFIASKSSDINPTLYVIDMATAELRKLEVGARWQVFPRWSPDGEWLAYVARDDQTGTIGVFRIRPDGSQRQALASDFNVVVNATENIILDWSPDGQSLVFAANRGHSSSIFNVEIATKTIKRLSQGIVNDVGAVWSGDGESLYFASLRDTHYGLYRMASDGTDSHQLSQNIGGEHYVVPSSPRHLDFHPSLLFGLSILGLGLSILARLLRYLPV